MNRPQSPRVRASVGPHRASRPSLSVSARALLVCTAVSACAPVASALNVFFDFNATWVSQLNAAATSAGVSAFSAAEVALVQGNIITQFNTIYAGYTLTVFTADPGGSRDRINFGGTTTSTGLYGQSPLHIGNSATGSTSTVYARNFASFIESADTRPQQILELSTSLAGTTAHEYGHSLGLLHSHAYGDPRITTANYASTGGFQNTHIMATGQSGLNELQRETPRTFSLYERVLLDFTGGTRFGGDSLVSSPVTAIDEPGGDAGNTRATATPLTFQTGESSLRLIAVRDGDLDGSTADLDYYSFTLASPAVISAEVFSENLFATDFDAEIRLFDSAGLQRAFSDDVFFSGNTFANTTPGSPLESDPWLLNVPLEAGTYFLEVSVSATPSIGSNVGDDYTLLVAIIPEPGAAWAALLVVVPLIRRRR